MLQWRSQEFREGGAELYRAHSARRKFWATPTFITCACAYAKGTLLHHYIMFIATIHIVLIALALPLARAPPLVRKTTNAVQ